MNRDHSVEHGVHVVLLVRENFPWIEYALRSLMESELPWNTQVSVMDVHSTDGSRASIVAQLPMMKTRFGQVKYEVGKNWNPEWFARDVLDLACETNCEFASIMRGSDLLASGHRFRLLSQLLDKNEGAGIACHSIAWRGFERLWLQGPAVFANEVSHSVDLALDVPTSGSLFRVTELQRVRRSSYRSETLMGAKAEIIARAGVIGLSQPCVISHAGAGRSSWLQDVNTRLVNLRADVGTIDASLGSHLSQAIVERGAWPFASSVGLVYDDEFADVFPSLL